MRRIAAIAALAVMGIAGVSAAVLVSSSEAAADDKTIFCSEYVPNAQAESNYAKWLNQNPGEKSRWEPFRDSICAGGNPTPPAMTTAKGRGLVAAGKMALPDVPPPTTTTTTTPPPPASGFPDASNTGVPAGVTLTVVNGDLNVSTAGQVIDGRDVRGCIILQAAGITVRNSKAECIIIDTTASLNGARHTFVDSEIRCDPSGWATGIRFGNFDALRLDISNCENGLDISRNVSLRDSYIHDLYQGNGSDDPHSDGIQGEVRDSVIEHNTIYAFTGTVQGTSAIIASGSTGGNMLIRNNLMAGGAYTLYCPRASGVPSFQVVNNRFSTISSPKVGAFGPSDDCADETLSGNVYHETGLLITLD